jgi:hypothetical protein
MVRKTDEEKLRELEEKMEEIKARKLQVESRLKEKERKARTKRLIEVGAIFEKYFEITGQEEAEKLAISLQKYVVNNKAKILVMTKEQLEQQVKKSTEQKREAAAIK